MIDLNEEHLRFIKEVLKLHFHSGNVFVFGSRVDGSSRQFSDLDLALDSDRPIPLRIISELRETFSESDLPFRVDVVDIARVSQEFKKIILSNCVIIQRKSSVDDKSLNGKALSYKKHGDD